MAMLTVLVALPAMICISALEAYYVCISFYCYCYYYYYFYFLYYYYYYYYY